MKMKQILSVLILMMVLVSSTTGTFVFHAYAEDSQIASVSEQRIQKLLRIGAIYNNAEYAELTRNIKRGEFARILVKFIGCNDVLPTQINMKPYVDVELDYPYIREIKHMKDLAIITDDKLLKFRPDDYITVFEAANMLDAALGYRKLAEKTYSARIDILDGVKKSDIAAATLDDIYIMLENCLEIEIFEPELWEVMDEKESETVLDRYYDLEKRRGTVTANPYTGISEAEKNTAKGYLEIDGVSFKSIDPEYEKYLGYTVDFYLDSVNEEILYVIPRKTTKTLTINSDNLLPSNQNTIYYKNDDGKRTKAQLRNYDVIFNKKAYSGYGNLNSVLSGVDGKITLLDREGDKTYDVVFVESYDHYFISAVDMQFGHIYDENNTRIDLSDEENTIIYKADGTRIKMAGISAETLISVAESKNTRGKKIKTVYLSEDAIEGKVSLISNEEIMINGALYKCSDSVLAEISVGIFGKFYIGNTGKIVKYIPVIESGWNLGVVYEKAENFLNTEVRLFTTNDEFEVYSISENARMDKTTEYPNGLKGCEAVYDVLSDGEIIRYQINDNGEIKRIQKADSGEAVGEVVRYANDTGLRLMKSGSSFHHYQNMFARSFGTNSNTKFFVIPTQENWSNEEEFSASPVTFRDDRDIACNYEAYSFGEKDIPIADVLVLKSDAAITVKTNDYMFVLDDLCCVINDGEKMYQLSGVSKGKNVSFLSEDNPETKFNIEEGDILIVQTKVDGTVDNIKKVFTLNTENNTDAYIRQGVNDLSFGPEASKITGPYVYVNAIVTGITGEGISYEYKITGEKAFGFLKNTTFTRYNIDEAGEIEVVPGTSNDIVVGDEVLIMTNYAKPNQIVVFKNR